MSLPEDEVKELQAGFPGAQVMTEGGYTYLYLPELRIVQGGAILIRQALFCPSLRDGYPNRLFVSEPIPGRGSNWKAYQILDRTWHSWSWNHVAPGRLAVVLAQHVAALR
ncbi:MAG: hypothetical protein ACYDDA_00400 [Acidiferrobacteraceae bacterium]